MKAIKFEVAVVTRLGDYPEKVIETFCERRPEN